MAVSGIKFVRTITNDGDVGWRCSLDNFVGFYSIRRRKYNTALNETFPILSAIIIHG